MMERLSLVGRKSIWEVSFQFLSQWTFKDATRTSNSKIALKVSKWKQKRITTVPNAISHFEWKYWLKLMAEGTDHDAAAIVVTCFVLNDNFHKRYMVFYNKY